MESGAINKLKPSGPTAHIISVLCGLPWPQFVFLTPIYEQLRTHYLYGGIFFVYCH